MKKKRLPVPAFSGSLPSGFTNLLSSQTRPMLSVNAELIRLYWDIGRMFVFFQAYPEPVQFSPQPAAELDASPKVQQVVTQLPAGNNAAQTTRLDQLIPMGAA